MNTRPCDPALAFSNMLQRHNIWQWGISYGRPNEEDRVIVSFKHQVVVFFAKAGDIYVTRTTEMGRKVWPSRTNLDQILNDVREALKDDPPEYQA